MEMDHGMDVSWMSSHSSQGIPGGCKDSSSEMVQTKKGISQKSDNGSKPLLNRNWHAKGPADETAVAPVPKDIPIPHRSGYSRVQSAEKSLSSNGNPKSITGQSSTSRRNSWLSSISSKFISPSAHNSQSLPNLFVTDYNDPIIPTGPSSPKNAILPHAQKVHGDLPYTPAPPKNSQPSFLQSALRRLSSSGGGMETTETMRGQQLRSICERRVLNVDKNRERCGIEELDGSKLRRVAFCVDVEIASCPKYHGKEADDKAKERERKNTEKKSEGSHEERKDVTSKTSAGTVLPEKVVGETTDLKDEPTTGEKDTSKKKEKKKRSEEERKARKEKKRRLAEANGIVPVELTKNSSETSLLSINIGTRRTQASPTIDPVRIYRRCCQLRETPILKRISEQLAAPANQSQIPGVVNKLELTGYWLQISDLVTLGDYLALVPIKEIVMDNCGLTDEGVRVILAGLLAAKPPGWEQKKIKSCQKEGEVPQGGFVERLVFKDNTNIGKDGWLYIATFIAMCRSLKCLDLSQVPLPQPLTASTSSSYHASTSSVETEISRVLGKAIGGRLAGKEFELLNLAECGLTMDQLGHIIDGIIISGLRRLGIAGNNVTAEGMHHVVRYVRHGRCEGLDLGGNDLAEQLGVLADALNENNELYALSLADCNLTPESLWSLFPVLSKLKNFRFIDLSQNRGLFDTEPSALSLLRRYLPKMSALRRIHLTSVSLTSEQAIALAEILPELPTLAHINILENPALAALATSYAKNEANQEEACALYASLMAAVRVSKTIVCVDIEVPSPDSSEVVKALARQVVAYCLCNMERGPVAEISADGNGGIAQEEKEIAVPDVLLHLVGHDDDGEDESLNADKSPAPDEDYVIGGTGVVKALGICLRNRGSDVHSRRPSFSGTATPRGGASMIGNAKPKEMSKNLLGSARKIRARLQPALIKESRAEDKSNYPKLLFLDQTLERMIRRFEDEYPETRVSSPTTCTVPLPDLTSAFASVAKFVSNGEDHEHDHEHEPDNDYTPSSDTDHGVDDDAPLRLVLSRHNSDVSLASRVLSLEEGRMHRVGMQFRRDILNPEEQSGGAEKMQEVHRTLLKGMVDCIGGEEIKKRILADGEDAVLEELNDDTSILKKRLMEQDPESWEKFVESQEVARRNLERGATAARCNNTDGSSGIEQTVKREES